MFLLSTYIHEMQGGSRGSSEPAAWDGLAATEQKLNAALVDDAYNPLLNYNSGVCAYKKGDYLQAKASFDRARLHATDNDRLCAQASFNKGNALYCHVVTCLGDGWEQKTIDEAVIDQYIALLDDAVAAYQDAVTSAIQEKDPALINTQHAQTLQQQLRDKKRTQEHEEEKQKQKQQSSDNEEKEQSSEQETQKNEQAQSANQSNVDESSREQSRSSGQEQQQHDDTPQKTDDRASPDSSSEDQDSSHEKMSERSDADNTRSQEPEQQNQQGHDRDHDLSHEESHVKENSSHREGTRHHAQGHERGDAEAHHASDPTDAMELKCMQAVLDAADRKEEQLQRALIRFKTRGQYRGEGNGHNW